MNSQVQRIAEQLGLRCDGEPIPVRSGLGGTELWRLPFRGADVLVRLFPTGAPLMLAEREAAVHTVASANGVATPAVLACDRVEDRPVLVMEWVDGSPISQRLVAGDDGESLGRRCGAVLADLHRIDLDTTPELDRVLHGRSWIDWAGPRADELRRLSASDSGSDGGADRLLHLDFHPENLMLTDGAVVVLDWANTRVGPPAAELARALSIVELVHDHPGMGDRQRAAVDAFGSGLLSGYAEAGGETHIPELVRAWAAAVQLVDLTADWVPAAYRDRLAERYRAIVANML